MSELPEGPLWITSVDAGVALGELVPPPRDGGQPYVGARVLVRVHGQPLGEVTLPVAGGRIAASDLEQAVEQRLGEVRRRHLAADAEAPAAGAETWPPLPPCSWQARLASAGVDLAADPPLVSVVLATCRRPVQLARTLTALAAQTYPHIEVLVVDNAPSTPGAAEVVEALQDDRFRLLEEPTPGLSRARNRGLRSARGEVVAITDDDVGVDPDWVGEIATPFYGDASLGCTTGLILPLKLESDQERLFEQFGGYAKGFEARTFSIDDRSQGPLFPYNAGLFGSGANMACRRSSFLAFGGFSDDLGAGTLARGGEDLDAYLSVLFAGQRLRYEPRAIVWHELPQHREMLARQVYSYGIGLAAMMTKRTLASSAERRAILRALLPGLQYLFAGDSPKNVGKTSAYPRRLTAYELAGLLYGPVAYLRSRRRRTGV